MFPTVTDTMFSRLRAVLQRLAGRINGPRIVACLLLVALTGQLAIIGRQEIPALRSSALDVVPALDIPAIVPSRGIDIGQILASQLFGSSPDSQADWSQATATQTSLLLFGVMAQSDPQAGWAILGASSTEARLQRAGSELSAGLRLVAVFADRVLIERGGVIEYLQLPKSSTGSATVAATASLVSRPGAIAGAIGQILNPIPVGVTGQQRGYRINGGASVAALQNQGLRAGDLLTAINGELLTDPARSRQVLDGLATVSQAVVTVMRGGKPKTVMLNLQQVSDDIQRETAPLPTEGVRDPIFRPFRRRDSP